MPDNSTLVLGLGEGGLKLAMASHTVMNADCAGAVTGSADAAGRCSLIRVRCNVLVPSVGDIRAAAPLDRIASLISGYDSVVIIANLAGRTGAALAPLVVRACRLMKKDTIAFCIMPFRYEKDRIFQAGLSLKRVRADSSCTIILDNDSMRECNPEMGVQDCYDAGNNALLYMIKCLDKADVSGSCVVATGGTRDDIDASMHDSVKMLYGMASSRTIRKSIIYVTGKIPAGMVDYASRMAEGVTGAPVSVVADGSGEVGVVLVSSASTISKFDQYDPLGVIPDDRVLDWQEPETRTNAVIDLHQME